MADCRGSRPDSSRPEADAVGGSQDCPDDGKFQRMSDEFKRQMMSLDRKIENEVESSLKDSSSEA